MMALVYSEVAECSRTRTKQNKRKTDIISSLKEAIDHGSAWGYGHYFPNIVSQIITISIIQTFVKNITFLKVIKEKG